LKEKENIETIRDVYEVEEYNISSVNIPKKEPFTLDSIPHIWMNIVEGETINTLIKRNDEINCRKIVPIFKKLLLHWFLTGVFKDGRFHADIHGGNVIVKNSNEKLLLTLIDFGNCSTLRENEQKAILKTIKKHYEIVKLIRDGCFCRKAKKEDVKECIEELLKVFIELCKFETNEEKFKKISENMYIFYTVHPRRQFYGTMTSILINNQDNLGSLVFSPFSEFIKGIFIIEKTWETLIKCANMMEEHKNIIEVIYDQVKTLPYLEQIKLWYKTKF
jgi:predicted unusual protein kinase regulating ubiquinone biosynthesis (AarF/ABC1/UbiB family)